MSKRSGFADPIRIWDRTVMQTNASVAISGTSGIIQSVNAAFIPHYLSLMPASSASFVGRTVVPAWQRMVSGICPK